MDWVEKLRRLGYLDRGGPIRLAAAAGMSPDYLRMAVRRRKGVTVLKAIDIARAAGVTVEWLFDDEAEFPAEKRHPTTREMKTAEEKAIRAEALADELRAVVQGIRQSASKRHRRKKGGS